jgi:CheY-like chemotaxis protein
MKRRLGSGYKIELAESGEETLEIVAELREEEIEIPLIISDQIMPEMKGDELLLQFHARTSTGKRSRRMCQPRQKRLFVQNEPRTANHPQG